MVEQEVARVRDLERLSIPMAQLPKPPGRTTPPFGFSYVERSLIDCLGKRQFKQKEQEQVLEFFEQWETQPACVFCGSTDVKRWDHVIPVSQGGETVAGNMVLACASCDDSKGKVRFDEWMTSAAPKSPTSRGIANVQDRIRHIRAYMTEFNHVFKSLNLRLTPVEYDRRDGLVKRLNELRQEVYSLIEDYRRRTGDR